jgi:4-alpha-glucanotransferase
LSTPREMAEAKRRLGIDRLVLQIHDASFPSDSEEDLGRGSPYSHGAARFFAWAADLGFDAIQFGPRGMTSRGNPSPYDATIFSRNPLNLPIFRFVESGRLSRATWESLRRSLPAPKNGVVPYQLVYDATQRALGEVIANASVADREAAREFLSIHEAWLVPDALYDELCREHGNGTWYEWNHTPQAELDRRLFDPPAGWEEAAAVRLEELKARYAGVIRDYALVQWLIAQEHRSLRDRLKDLGLAVYGDLQVGLSLHDTWAWQRLFLHGYRLGAPPSRTNRAGQPWGYAVFDPYQFGTPQSPGPALSFVRARIRRMLAECDGVRIDHPHGWVDPWVYRADDPDPLHAVQFGARMFSSPDDPGHPELQRCAIARPDQIDRSQPLYADGRVSRLDDDQVQRYSILMDEIVAELVRAGRSPHAVACEVLSTLPYPVGRVMERHGLGRFRVTQKIDLTDPADVYRIENARPQDWIMLGTHDTATIWHLAEQWCRGPQAAVWGRYLSGLLAPPPERDAAADASARNPGELVNACFTAMLASEARHVVVFFPDLFGMTARYNEPGLVSDSNWSLRVPTEFEKVYDERVRAGTALNVRTCIERALAARG